MPRLPRPSRTQLGAARRGLLRGAGWVWSRPRLLAFLIAALFFTITWPVMPQTHEVTASLQPVLALATVAPLVVLAVGQPPFVAWAVCGAVSVVWLLIPRTGDWPMPWPVTHFMVLLLTVLLVAMYARTAQIAITTIATAVVVGIVMPDELKPWALGMVIVVAFGLLARWLVISRRQIALQEEETEVERARRAVLEERSRIARELHDVVAHHMSMVVVQAQSAPYRVGELTPEAKGEFLAIEESARAALQEVRGVLGVLREEGAAAQRSPQPTLADLPSLLETSRAAGMDLTWHLGLDPDDCPPGTGLVLHRVLQESLANSSRHSPGAAVRVELVPVHPDGAPAGALLTVGTSPSSGAATAERGGGNGIPGMRTRVEAVGGTLTAGPTPEGGFAVTASVPLADRPRLGE